MTAMGIRQQHIAAKITPKFIFPPNPFDPRKFYKK